MKFRWLTISKKTMRLHHHHHHYILYQYTYNYIYLYVFHINTQVILKHNYSLSFKIDKCVKTFTDRILTKHSLVKIVQKRTLTMGQFFLEVVSSDKD